MFEPGQEATRLWTDPGLRKRADTMFELLADVHPQRVAGLVKQLAALNEFWLVMRLLDAVDYGAPATTTNAPRPELHQQIRALAELGDAVLNIDAHNFENWLSHQFIPEEIKSELALRVWPIKRTETAVGALKSLLPTFELLWEVFEVRVLKGDVTMALSIVHLMAEYLPLLGWEKTLGHAGNPIQLAQHLTQDGVMWKNEVCPLNRQHRRAFDSVLEASDSEKNWNDYLHDTHSRVASALTLCAGVPNPLPGPSGQRTCRTVCTVRSGGSDLAWAMVLVRRLRDSSLLMLRHDAPVGHFFSVPDEKEILRTWETTWEGLLADRDEAPAQTNPLRGVTRTGALPGLPELIAVVVGRPEMDRLEPSNVIGKISQSIQDLTNSF